MLHTVGEISEEQNNDPTGTKMQKGNNEEKQVQFKGLEPGPVWMVSGKRK